MGRGKKKTEVKEEEKEEEKTKKTTRKCRKIIQQKDIKNNK